MAEIRINATGGVKLYDADDSHYAQIVAGTITSNVDAITLGHNIATFNAAVTAGGVLKTDDATEATSTTDGSLQTDGGLSVVKDAVFGDDVKLLSDSSVVAFGADGDTTLTHTDGTGLTLNSTNKLTFGDAASYIQQSSDGVLKINGEATVDIDATAAITLAAAGVPVTVGGIPFYTSNTTSIYTHDVSGTDDSADYNAAYGRGALDAVTTGDKNVAIGYAAGGSVTTGGDQVFIGVNAGTAITTGTNNVAIGNQCYYQPDTETHNLAIGTSALAGAVAGGEYNVMIGNYAGDALTSGDSNTAVGYNAGSGITTGYNNTFMGRGAGLANTTGGTNTFIGFEAGNSSTTGYRNTVVGDIAYDDGFTSEGDNTAIGYGAMGNSAVGNGAEFNTVMGSYAADAITTGDHNTAIGYTAGTQITTGYNNTFIGTNAGDDSTTAFRNVCIGSDCGTNAQDDSYAIAIGDNVDSGTNNVTIGKSGNVIATDFTSNGSWTQSSDERIKTNIQNDTLGLGFINDLRTVTYKWKPSQDIPEELTSHYNAENQKNTDIVMHGLVAQEVKAALDTAGISTFGGWKEIHDGSQNLSREMFVIPLIKAVQELSAKVTALENA
jgi:hypothetical protein